MMKQDDLNRDTIQNLLNELYDNAFEKGFHQGNEQVNESCQADTRVGVIISEGGKIDHHQKGVHFTQDKSTLIEDISAKLVELLKAGNV